MRLDLSILFISSYFPLYIFIMLLKWDVLLNAFYENWLSLPAILLYLLIIGIGLSTIVVIYIKLANFKKNTKLLLNIERDSDSIISYIFTYIIPLLTAFNDEATGEFLLVNSLLFVLVWYLYIKLKILHLNPLLAMLGFIPYKTDDSIVITDLSFNELLELKNSGVEIIGMSIDPGIFIAKRKDNI